MTQRQTQYILLDKNTKEWKYGGTKLRHIRNYHNKHNKKQHGKDILADN